ncbi:SAM dependent carboxyl methyltransferase [Melia azedarach]|uniref:SAM dependent carboxyl methyltransferase n=1 Tax=Melia azedarach TaxID=155640 RepID=A0ACC1Y1T6_MELAZ|nr:SAM dependent carboxyl methyltransferase [Melia azedarach]
MASSGAFTMTGGDAAYSYTKNSTIQRDIVDAGKELIKEAISEKFDLKSLGFDTPSTVVNIMISIAPNFQVSLHD